MRRTGRRLADLVAGMRIFPQVLINVRTASRVDLAAPAIRDAVAAVEKELGDRGRVVLRASGTEPVVRVMVEGEVAADVRRLAEIIAQAVKAVAPG
jgi:phosphoglucosamine mutase